jgi:hypothetical protein
LTTPVKLLKIKHYFAGASATKSLTTTTPEPFDPIFVQVVTGIRNLAGTDSPDGIDVFLRQNDVLPGHGIRDGDPVFRIVHSGDRVINLFWLQLKLWRIKLV